MLKEKNPIVVLGCGFLGRAVASLFSSHGYSVFGLTRHPRTQEIIEENAASSYSILNGDVTDCSSLELLLEKLPAQFSVIYSVSSGRGGSDAYASIYRDGLSHVLKIWKPRRVLFVSSTSVYGQVHGELVDETSPTLPESPTSRILLEAEQIALRYNGLVARLSGIYGPGRSILLEKFLNGTAVLENGGDRFLNQIHRDDAARALFFLLTEGEFSGIYNVTDDTPATQRTVYAWMAEVLDKPLPNIGPADLHKKRGWTSKRISNEKLKSTGWVPNFRSYRDALPSLLKERKALPSEIKI